MYEFDAQSVAAVEADPPSFYWVRLLNTASQEIEDIPVQMDRNDNQANFVLTWTQGAARCDCIRGLTFYKIRNQEQHMKCGYSRMRLLGIWNPEGELIHIGD